MSPSALRRRALLSGSMLVAAAVGYGRRAYAACVNSGGSTYQCSGANLTTQNIIADNAAVSTLPGFSVNTVSGNGITIFGDGALSYTDIHASPVTGQTYGLYVRTLGGVTGSVTINTNGAISANYFGIKAFNYDHGALTITANGNVSTHSGSYSGIYAKSGTAGTGLSVTTGTGTTVSGGAYGVDARNLGSGALTVTANGDVTGAHYGIRAYNRSTASTSLTVTTAAGTTVRGGIAASNYYGTGATAVTVNGDVMGTIGAGIRTFNNSASTGGVTVITAAGTTVSGNGYGIEAGNYGNGALTITANGNVTGNGAGIHANSSANSTGLNVTTAIGTTVSGGGYGIRTYSRATGAVAITTNGDVAATTGDGILALNYGAASSLSITTAAGTTVSGGDDGIRVRNFGTTAPAIIANGDVTGTAVGIYGFSTGSAIAITVGATGTVTSTGTAATSFAIQTKGGAATVTVAGTVNGGAGGAIQFAQTGAFADRLELVTGAVINGNVLGGNGTDTLGLSGSGSGSFNVAQLVSFEAGQKTGSGSWTLTGANTGITAFSVGAGTLFVNGSLGNAAFTVSGGTLGGAGTVGNTSVAGGTFAPGSGTPGSFMTVNGTLGFNAASTYAVNLNPATSSFANVSGTATLGGATVNAIFASGSYFARQYTILTAGTRSGNFGAIANTNLPTNFTDTLSYDATHAYLDLSLSFQQQGDLNGNQQAVANALTRFFNTTGGIPGVFGGLTPAGLTQLSGEAATGSQQTTFNAMNQFMGLLTDPFIDGRGDGPGAGGGTSTAPGYASTQKPAAIRDAYAMFTKAPPAVSFEQRWSVWGAGFGGSQTTDGNAALGSNTATSSIAGTAVGADYRFSPFTLAGFALAGGGTSFGVNGLGSGRSDLFQAGAFIRHTVGPAYLTAALAYGWQDVTTNRTVTVAGTDMLRAEFNANAFSGRLEGGYRFVAPFIGGIGITPYAAGQFTTFDLPAYAEQAIAGANTFALAYGARDVTDSRSELGLRTDKSFAMPSGVLTLRGRFAWAHDFNPDRAIAATFQTLPGASFVVNGAAQAHDKALTTASAEMKWINGWSAATTFEGEFSDVTRSYAGKGVLRYQW